MSEPHLVLSGYRQDLIVLKGRSASGEDVFWPMISEVSAGQGASFNTCLPACFDATDPGDNSAIAQTHAHTAVLDEAECAAGPHCV